MRFIERWRYRGKPARRRLYHYLSLTTRAALAGLSVTFATHDFIILHGKYMLATRREHFRPRETLPPVSAVYTYVICRRIWHCYSVFSGAGDIAAAAIAG